MTKNQIEYAKLEETTRNNQARIELDTQNMLHDVRIREEANAETHRANQAREAYNMLNLSEVQRHNAAIEQYNLGSLNELSRHNRATESQQERMLGLESLKLDLNRSQLQEQIRSNVSRELETNRSNVAKEAETHRSNLAKEAETYRSNTAKEDLTRKGQLVDLYLGDLQSSTQRYVAGLNYDVQSKANSIRAAELTSLTNYRNTQLNLEGAKTSESIRHNKTAEREANRHNVSLESISSGELAERQRHNKTTESIDSRNATSRRIVALSRGIGTISDVILDWRSSYEKSKQRKRQTFDQWEKEFFPE